MSLFDTNDDNTQAQGGLSILNRLRGQVDNGGNQQRGGGWGDIWAARGGFNFSLKNSLGITPVGIPPKKYTRQV